MSYDLNRFIKAQDAKYEGYASALSEIKGGRKLSHWIWYVFPQLKGLGWSSIAQYYGIDGVGEAAAYFAHPILGARLIEISRALIDLGETDAAKVLGHTDAMKVRSCMTLFLIVDPGNETFQAVLDKYYGGGLDERTREIIKTRQYDEHH